jgi:hypothetical protein
MKVLSISNVADVAMSMHVARQRYLVALGAIVKKIRSDCYENIK